MNHKGYCIGFLFFILSCASQAIPVMSHEENKQIIPLGGNAWVANGAKISENGLENWTNSDQICKVYFKVAQVGKLKLSLYLSSKNCTIDITIAGQAKTIQSKGESEIMVGEWDIKKAGYVEVQFKGVEKKEPTFGVISSLGISGSSINTEMSYVKNNEGNYFYWGRRGPSVHLNYITEGLGNIEWFYSEITVPENNDIIGSYYMANGFKEGYFGMQVNSEFERRILFSIWSPFTTDDPSKIPAEKKIILLKKGQNVLTGEFGIEGAGGQSYLKYNWEVNNTYKFLVGAKPDFNGFTVYSAYFFAPEENKWLLIATFKRPQTNTYLKGLYSFLENFDTQTGNVSREARYNNQWAFDSQKGWIEINRITFSADATARIGYRKDYAGGLKGEDFYLKNCGFFDENVEIKTAFERPLKKGKPQIDFQSLP